MQQLIVFFAFSHETYLKTANYYQIWLSQSKFEEQNWHNYTLRFQEIIYIFWELHDDSRLNWKPTM